MRYLLASFVAVVLLSAGFITIPMQAQAASLTSAQVSAIISLLQSFGADQSVINNVSVALGGTSSGTQSCSTFADITYGMFDTDPGGRVSQLQTWLGISSNTFGFGTYGPKTRALWNSKCGGTQTTTPPTTYTTPTTQTNSIKFTATPTSGTAPLTVSFSQTAVEDWRASVDFGDGQSCGQQYVSTNTEIGCGWSTHTYFIPGTYTAKLVSTTGTDGANRPPLATATIMVTGSNPISFSASPSSGTAPLTVTFQAAGLQSGVRYVLATGESSAYDMTSANSTQTYSYRTPGTYTAKLYMNNSVVASRVITIGNSSSLSATCNVDYPEGANIRSSVQSSTNECKSYCDLYGESDAASHGGETVCRFQNSQIASYSAKTCRIDYPEGANIRSSFQSTSAECKSYCDVYGNSDAASHGGATVCKFQGTQVASYNLSVCSVDYPEGAHIRSSYQLTSGECKSYCDTYGKSDATSHGGAAVCRFQGSQIGSYTN